MKYLILLWSFFLLRRNTKKTRADIKAIQEKKLRKLLRYAYNNSKYHRRRFEELGITQDNLDALPLSAFPTMDKAILMEHFEEIVTQNDLCQEELRRFDEQETEGQKMFKNKYHLVHSSGSTGKPSYYVYDDNAWQQMLVGIIRGALWNMNTISILKLLKDPRIVYIAATDGRYGGAMAVGAGIEGLHAKQLFLDIKTPIAQWITDVKEFKPNVIIGYPSAIKILAELVEKGKVTVDVSRVISCGEPLGKGLRSYMESAFNAEVVNLYGASESLALGVETGKDDGMILFDDMNYIEVENKTMYLTSLYNFVQPLIRYRISDQLVIRSDKDENNHPFSVAEILLGRNEDLLWFEDEKGNKEFLHPLAIEGFCIDGLLDFQFHQTGRASFEMLAEVLEENKKENIKAEMLRQMGKILQEKQLEYIQFAVQFVEEILPDSKTGKKKLIVNSK